MIHLDKKSKKVRSGRLGKTYWLTIYLFTCDECGVELGYQQKNYKYGKCHKCGGKEAGKKIRGDKHYRWKGVSLNQTCTCGSKKDKYAKTCAMCIDFSGSKNPNWKKSGHITPIQKLIRTDLRYKNWVRLVMERDGFVCQYTGEKGGTLNVHHHKITLSSMIQSAKLEGLTTSKEIAERVIQMHDISMGITVNAEYHKKVIHGRGINAAC